MAQSQENGSAEPSVETLQAQVAERDQALTAAGAEIDRLTGELDQAKTAADDRITAAGEESKRLSGLLDDAAAENVALKQQLAAAKSSAKAKKGKPPEGELTVTVLTGVVRHPAAEEGQAGVGESFNVSASERADLQGLANRRVIALEG